MKTDPNPIQYDLVIRGGKIVDGTRMPAFKGDIAIKDGLIAEIGSIEGKGKQEIDANGLIVAPGFVDIHTHYDAQLQWDPYASQSCWHGITTIAISVCGFGFAPCKPEYRERAMVRMTRVESIPYEAMKLGMRWDWVTQNDYLNSLEKAGLGVNVASYIPHSAIRAYVLNEEDTKRAQLTSEELEQMKELVRDGYRAGALGLSTDHNLIDRDYNGDALPSVVATKEEMDALVGVAREFNVGSIEVTPNDFTIAGEVQELLNRYATVSGRPVIHTTVIQQHHKKDEWKLTLKNLEELNKDNRVYGLGVIHRIPPLVDLRQYNLFDDMEAWNKALNCPIDERIKNLADPDVRKGMQHDIEHQHNRAWSGRWDKMYVHTSQLRKDYEGRYISAIAQAEGKNPLDVFCDLAVEEKLEALFAIEDLASDDDAANVEILKNPYVVPGVSDGGAHVQFISMGKFPTYLLSKIVRDDKEMTLEEAHWRLSYFSAATLGIDGLGTLAPGMPADIVVYDLENLGLTTDKPYFEPILGGGQRLVERAKGYRAIIVNGVPTFEYDECTGALPGRIVRTSAYDPDYFTAAIAAE